MAGKDTSVRLYVVDKPSFLSCGNAYFTDLENEIVLYDNNYGRGKPKLAFRMQQPYALAPYPLTDELGNAPISKGTKVFPFCMVDTPGGYDPRASEIPTVLDMVVLSMEELKSGLDVFTEKSDYHYAVLNQALRKVRSDYRPFKQRLAAEIQSAKVRATKACGNAPDLVKMVLAQRKE